MKLMKYPLWVLIVLAMGGAVSGAPITNCTTINSSGYYYLANDIINASSTCIAITASDVVLDGRGHVIDGKGSGYGIYASNVGNVSIENVSIREFYWGVWFRNVKNSRVENCTISNNNRGVYLDSSSSNTLSGNTISNNNWEGVDLEFSSSNTLSGNIIFSNNDYGVFLEYYSNNNTLTANTISNNNGYGVSLDSSRNNTLIGNTFIHDGLVAWHSYNNTVENNTVNGRALVYLENQINVVVENAGQVIAINSENITVRNSNLSYTDIGVEFWNVNNSRVENSTISNNYWGVYLDSSSSNTLTANTISNNNVDGVFLKYSSNNTVSANKISNNNWNGVALAYSSNNTLSDNNTISNNGYGVFIKCSSNNIITANTVSNNNRYGVYFLDSSSNILTANTISNNYLGVYLYGVYLDSSSNILSGNIISYNGYGVFLKNSSNNTIAGNTISKNNLTGVFIDFSSNNNTITGNTFISNGLLIAWSYNNTVENNTVNGKPLVYVENQRDVAITDAGQVIAVNSQNITIRNLNLSFTYVGVEFWNVSNSRVENCTISSNNGYGIYLEFSIGNTITGNTISDNNRGVSLRSSSSNILSGNTISNNKYGVSIEYSCNNIFIYNKVFSNNWIGVYLEHSCNNTLSGNTIFNNNGYGVDLDSSRNNTLIGNTFIHDGLVAWHSYNNTVENNTVNGRALVYLENQINVVVENAGQVIAINSENITVRNSNLSYTDTGVEFLKVRNSKVENCTISNNNRGVHLLDSSNNIITANTISDNEYGVDLKNSKNNFILDNTISKNRDGVDLYDSSNNTLSGNIISNNNRYGVYLFDSSNNTLSGNPIFNNRYGVYLEYSHNNTLTANTISNNNKGVDLDYSSNNLIYNNLFNNSENVVIWTTNNNSWNTSLHAGMNILDGSLIGGNAWLKPDGSGFGETCTDADNNGICDSAYTLASGNVDNLPLKYPQPAAGGGGGGSVDTLPPSITFIAPTPANGTLFPANFSLFINITSSEDLRTATLHKRSYYPNGTLMVEDSIPLQGSGRSWHANLSFIDAPSQLIEFWVTAQDLAGNNTGESNRRVIIVDATPPEVRLIRYRNGSVISRKYLQVEVIADEPLSEAVLYFDGANYTMHRHRNRWVYNITGITEGWHTFYVAGRDIAGNLNFTVNYTLFADLTPPDIIPVALPSGNLSHSVANFSFRILDNFAKYVVYFLYIDDTILRAGYKSNDTTVNLSIPVTHGYHSYKIESYANYLSSLYQGNFTVVSNQPPELLTTQVNSTESGITTVELRVRDLDTPRSQLRFIPVNITPSVNWVSLSDDGILRLSPSYGSGSTYTANISISDGVNTVYGLVEIKVTPRTPDLSVDLSRTESISPDSPLRIQISLTDDDSTHLEYNITGLESSNSRYSFKKVLFCPKSSFKKMGIPFTHVLETRHFSDTWDGRAYVITNGSHGIFAPYYDLKDIAIFSITEGNSITIYSDNRTFSGFLELQFSKSTGKLEKINLGSSDITGNITGGVLEINGENLSFTSLSRLRIVREPYPEGRYQLRITASDEKNGGMFWHPVTSVVREISIKDALPPRVEVLYPVNNSTILVGDNLLVARLSDGTSLKNYTLLLNGNAIFNGTISGNTVYRLRTHLNYRLGNNTITIISYDTANHSAMATLSVIVKKFESKPFKILPKIANITEIKHAGLKIKIKPKDLPQPETIYVNASLFRNVTNRKIKELEKPVKYFEINLSESDIVDMAEFNVSYSEDELPEGINEEDLRIYYYNESTGNWEEIDSKVYPDENIITGWVNHFSIFGLGGSVHSSSGAQQGVLTASSGGGGGGAAPTGYEVKISKADKGKFTELILEPEKAYDIYEVEIKPKMNLYNARLKVEDVDRLPSYIGKVEGKDIYKYIKLSFSSSAIEEVKIRFRVNVSWLKSEEINPDSVKLFRYFSGKWHELDTKKLKAQDSKYILYEAITPGFSYFAIAGEAGSGFKEEKTKEVVEKEEKAKVEIPEIPAVPENKPQTEEHKPSPEVEENKPAPVAKEKSRRKLFGICGPSVVALLAAVMVIVRRNKNV